MILENKLGIREEKELEIKEEQISKIKALELFDKSLLDGFPVSEFKGLAMIHKHLYEDIYDFAGHIRHVNIIKGSFPFALSSYLPEILKNIFQMPQSTFDEIIEKYIEMNIAHPFRDGNGRSMRIWLDCIMKKEVKSVVEWSKISKEEYMNAMAKSPVSDNDIKTLICNALTHKTADRQVYIEGIDASYAYEGYSNFKLKDMARS